MVLCACLRTALLLFVCYLYNIKRNGKMLTTEKTNKSPSPLNVCSNPASTCMASVSQWAPAGSDYVYQGEHELPECHTPSCACVPTFCLSDAEAKVFSAPPSSFPAMVHWFTVAFGPEFSKLQSVHLGLQPITSSQQLIPAAKQCFCLASRWHKGAQPGHTLLGYTGLASA